MQRLMRGSVLLGVLGLGVATLHCGGEAVIDPPLGSGGTSGSTTTDTTTSSSNMSVTVVTVTTTSGQSDCEVACQTIYNCGLENNNCPGFDGTPSDREEFVFGEDGCVETCDDNPLLISLVNPNDCNTTIDSLKAASGEFAEGCDDGL